MARRGVAADVVTYNALLAVCVGVAQHGRAALPEALAVLNSMKRAGISPDAITFNTLLEVVAAASVHGLSTARDAERVLDLMIDCAIPFEITSFRALVRVWEGERSCAKVRSGRLGGGERGHAAEIVASVPATPVLPTPSHPLNPFPPHCTAMAAPPLPSQPPPLPSPGTAVAARSLLTPSPCAQGRKGAMERSAALLSVIATAAWAGAAGPADVLALLDRLRIDGLQPTCAMYNLGIEAAIGAASNSMCSLQDGMQLLDHMRSHQIDGAPLSPDHHTYMLLINFIAVVAKQDPRAQPAAAKEVLNVLSQMRNGGLVPTLPLLDLALDVFVAIALRNAAGLSARLVQTLLQEVLEPQVTPTAVTLSKAAHLATLVARPQVSDLVWTMYARHAQPQHTWDEETHLEVLCAVCAAPPPGRERDERITLLLRAFNKTGDGWVASGESAQGLGMQKEEEVELLRLAAAAAMSAARDSPSTVLFLKRYMLAHGEGSRGRNTLLWKLGFGVQGSGVRG
jgi:hypothetical protein